MDRIAATAAKIAALKDALRGATNAQATSSAGGLEDADADDLASLERLREEATRACMKEMEDHLVAFLKDMSRGTIAPSYEEWVTFLHPENSKRAPDGAITLDARFYVDRSDHRRLWNRMQPQSPVAPREPPPKPPRAARAHESNRFIGRPVTGSAVCWRARASGMRRVSVRKMAAESRKKAGRSSLWSPSKVTRFLSPLYAL